MELWSNESKASYPMLYALRDNWSHSQKLRGLQILHNIPNSLDTLLKVESLISAGAEVTVARMKAIRVSNEEEAIRRMIGCGASFISSHEDIIGEYDIHLDCNAELLPLPAPRLGAVELTQTGDELYARSSRKSVSVDNSITKGLEGLFGTGQGFLRAFIEKVKRNPSHEFFLVFGYGKVGQGIVRALRNQSKGIAIVDICKEPRIHKEDSEYTFIHPSESETLSAIIKRSTVIVTATGLKNLITELYDPEQFRGKCLCNMGAEDEYGSAFSHEEIQNDKIALNFCLDKPTEQIYLDPIFYAHNFACEVLINSSGLVDGYNALPIQEDLRIVHEWEYIHGIDISPLFLNRPDVLIAG